MHNTPLELADDAATIAVQIFDEQTQSSAEINIGQRNTRPITSGGPDAAQPPTNITVAVDGSFRVTTVLEAGSWKTVTMGRYGFIALTPWLHTHWERLQQIKDNEELCRDRLEQSR